VTAIRPAPGVLEGRYIRLEPMTRDHLPALFRAIAHPIVFASGYGGGPAGYRDSLSGFTEWAAGYFDWNNGNVYAVVVSGGPHSGEIVGTTTLSDFAPEREGAHIGWTAYDPRVWGTAVNADAKHLLLGVAFGHGFGRIQILADAINERSRSAILRLGATFEGVARRHLPRADGSWRDSAVFSIIIDDWPAVRARLEERLDAHDDRPILYRAVPTGGARPH